MEIQHSYQRVCCFTFSTIKYVTSETITQFLGRRERHDTLCYGLISIRERKYAPVVRSDSLFLVAISHGGLVDEEIAVAPRLGQLRAAWGVSRVNHFPGSHVLFLSLYTR